MKKKYLIALTLVLISIFSIYLALTIFHTYRFLSVFIPSILIFIILVKFSKYAYKINILFLTLVAFILYLSWGLYAMVTPYSDFMEFYKLSTSFANTGNLNILSESKSPTTIAYYAFFVSIFGKSNYVFYIASSLIWSIQVPLLYLSLKNFKIINLKAKFISLIYGLYPGVIFFATVVSSESVFMFFLMFNFYLISKLKNGQLSRIDTSLLGLSLSLLFLTRGGGIAFIIPFLLYYIGNCFFSKKHYTIFIISILTPLMFQLNLNIKFEDRVSISTSHWAPYLFMVGTNENSNGGYSLNDLELAGFRGSNKVPIEEAKNNAITIALDRIGSDPLRFIAFSLTTKIKYLWRTDSQSILWGTNRSPKKDLLTNVISVGTGLLDSIFLLIKTTALFYLLWMLVQYREILHNKSVLSFHLLILGSLTLLALLHIFIEVQTRYHTPFIPFLSIYSGLFILKYLDILIFFKNKIKLIRGMS
jgi:hypothetical protein